MRACTSCRTACRSSTTTAARRQQAVNTEGARHAELSARLEALKALQEKVKTDGKLAPWLAKHGLEGLQGLWSRIHIEQGWENALEAALRERLGALEVSAARHGARLRQRRAAGQAGLLQPAARPPRRKAPGALPRLADLLRLNDAGQQALLADWLHGCFTAPTLRRGAGRSATSCSPAR